MNRIAALSLAVTLGATTPIAMAQAPSPDTTLPPTVAHPLKHNAAMVALARAAASPSVAGPFDSAPPAGQAYERARSLESTDLRQALSAYREAAQRGHGPAQKRLWELLKDMPGSEWEAEPHQRAAWESREPGVRKPKGPVRFN